MAKESVVTNMLFYLKSLVTEHMPIILAFERLRLEDCCEFKTSLLFVCLIFQQDLVQKQQEVISLLKLNVALAAEAVPDELALEAGVGVGWGGGRGRQVYPPAVFACQDLLQAGCIKDIHLTICPG